MFGDDHSLDLIPQETRVLVGISPGEVVDYIHAIDHLTEDGMKPIEMGRGHEGDEELAAVGSSMGDIVWAIDPRRESLLDLVRRMRQHVEEVFALRDIELRFNVPSAVDSFKLGMEVRRDLLLLFKEAVNNAARHSGCSAVAIDLHVTGSRVLLTVADNGAAFDASVGSEGQGLTSMQRRARRLGGTLNITSAIGSGTTVSLDVPL